MTTVLVQICKKLLRKNNLTIDSNISPVAKTVKMPNIDNNVVISPSSKWQNDRISIIMEESHDDEGQTFNFENRFEDTVPYSTDRVPRIPIMFTQFKGSLDYRFPG